MPKPVNLFGIFIDVIFSMPAMRDGWYLNSLFFFFNKYFFVNCVTGFVGKYIIGFGIGTGGFGFG